MSKFKALKEILEGVAPTVAKEGEEAAASALAKEAEEATAREAFKSEFSLPVAHATSATKTGGKQIEEFIPSTDLNASYGEGVYTAVRDPLKTYTGEYLTGEGQYHIPLQLRGNKVFNYSDSFSERHPELGHLIPSRKESVSKLSKLSGMSEEQIYELIENNGINQINDLVKKYPEHFESIYFDKLLKTFKPENLRGQFAKYDPAKRKSRNYMDSIAAATTGAGVYSAFSPESAEASEIREKPKSQLKDLLKDYSPSFGSKTGDYSSYDESEALPTEGMQGQGLATIIRNIVADKKPKGEFEEGGGGIEESTISPIDLVTPGMVAAPAKALGRGALTAGKAGLEAVESGAQALAKRYPELAKRLADNRGSIYLTKEAEEAAAREAFKSEFEPGWYHGTHDGKTKGNPIERFNRDTFFTKDPDFASNYSQVHNEATGSQIIPTSLNTSNFFNPNNTEHLKSLEDSLIQYFYSNPEMRLFEKALYENKPYDMDSEKRARHIIDTLKGRIENKQPTWTVLEDKNVEKALKNAGFDGAFLTEQGAQNAISYLPENARLPWAKFDPKKRGSGDTLAGLVGAGLTFDQIKQLLDKNSSYRNEF